MKRKTLEETIRGLEICSGEIDECDGCPYRTSEKIKGDQTCDEYEVPLMMKDAVYHLKKYKKLFDDMEKIALNSVSEAIDKLNNNALSWEELESMSGKPVWIRDDDSGFPNYNGWAICGVVNENKARFVISTFKDNFWTQELGYPKSTYGTTWWVYRNEKNEVH